MKNLNIGLSIFLILFFGFSFDSLAATQISCVGKYSLYKSNSEMVEKNIPLEITMEQGGYIRHEVELEGRNLSVLEETATLDLMAFITTAPDYTDGILSKGTLNSKGEFKFSHVTGALVYTIFCKKL